MKLRYNYIPRDNEWVALAEEAFKVSNLRKQIDLQEKELMERLKILSEDTNSSGGGFYYTISESKGSIDYKSIPALKTIDLEPYRNSPTKRRILEFTGI